MPRIDSRKCSLDGTKGKNKTDLSTSSKWQIDLIFVVEGSPARCVSERSKGGDYAPGDSKGHTLGAPLVTFPASGKSPGVEGRSALLVRAGAKPDDLPRGLPPRKGTSYPHGRGGKRGNKKEGVSPLFF